MQTHVLRSLFPIILTAFAGGLAATALFPVSAASASAWTSHATDHHYVAPREEGVALTNEPGHVRMAWNHAIHTGFGQGGSGTAVSLLNDGFDPAYGETGSPVLSDGVLLVSWSQPSGEVVADLSTITDRYFRNEDHNALLQDNYFRIDADWHTMALDAATGEHLWTRVQPSASLNFLSTKRSHNGLNAAARDGLYVTVTIIGKVFAYEIATGNLLWSFTIPDWHALAGAHKQNMLDTRTMPTQTGGPFGTKRSGAVIVDDVVVVPDVQSGLIGLSVTDGKVLWSTGPVLHPQATPIPWTHEGKTYLICNNAGRLDRNGIHLLDPADGSTLWTFPTNGYNPGQLLVGEDHLFLNNSSSRNDDALLECYEIGLDGLKRRWQFEDTSRNRVEVRDDRGAFRKGVIQDGVVYLLAGTGRRPERGYLVSFDLATGAVIHEPDTPRLRQEGMPFIAEDKLFLRKGAGFMVYQLHGDGQFTYLHDVPYGGFGIDQVTDYLHPMEVPYAGGKVYIRGHRRIAALDFSVVTKPWADLLFEGGWAGFHRPLRAFMFAGQEGGFWGGRIESPPRLELGIVLTTDYRMDSWTDLILPEDISADGVVETDAEFNFVTFSWPATLRMQRADGREWTGTWSRYFPGWEEPLSINGELHESSEGGYDQKSWPTDWLPDQPVTFFGPLPDGQERVHLHLVDCLPNRDGLRDLTLSLDHDGERVVAGVGGAFSFNQAYHEIDPDSLVVTPDGISGTALIILNSDRWVQGDWQNGGSLAGYITLDVVFGEPDGEGIYPVSGSWSAEWGVEHTRSGSVTAILHNVPSPRSGLRIRRGADPQAITLSFFAEAGAVYQVETSATMEDGSWVPSGAQIEGAGEEIDTHQAFEGGRRFFRVIERTK